MSGQTKHTPGEWSADNHGLAVWVKDPYGCGDMLVTEEEAEEICQANMKLIASVPKLLAERNALAEEVERLKSCPVVTYENHAALMKLLAQYLMTNELIPIELMLANVARAEEINAVLKAQRDGLLEALRRIEKARPSRDEKHEEDENPCNFFAGVKRGRERAANIARAAIAACQPGEEVTRGK